MTLQYWFMFPVAILIATIAMAAGVGGATFFTPMFILTLGLPPDIAIGTGLITQVFGFASGVYAYANKGLIDYRIGMTLLVGAVPMALLGTLAANLIASDILKIVLGLGLFAMGINFLPTRDHQEAAQLGASVKQNYSAEKGESILITREDEELRYTVRNLTEGRLIAAFGGLFVGMISTGLGELNAYFLLQRARVPSKVSVATNVFIVALTSLVASAGHYLRFSQIGGDVLSIVLSIVIFTVPGVILGAQLGSKISSRIPQKAMERFVGILFLLVAALTLGEVIL